jgi:MoaD family protein
MTIEDLLQDLSLRFGPEFSAMVFEAETGIVSSNVKILINGRHYRNLPNKLKTRLASGDEVSLFPPIAGG